MILSFYLHTAEIECNSIYQLKFVKNHQGNCHISRWSRHYKRGRATWQHTLRGSRDCAGAEGGLPISLRKTSLGRKSATENPAIIYHELQSQMHGKVLFIRCLEFSLLLPLTNGEMVSALSSLIKSYQKGASGFSFSSDGIKPEQNCFLPCTVSRKWGNSQASGITFHFLFCHCCPQKYPR